MSAALIIALSMHFIHVTAPDGKALDVAVDQIIRVRPSDDTYHPEAKCLIDTSDGKSSAVRETCPQIEQDIDEVYRSRRQVE